MAHQRENFKGHKCAYILVTLVFVGLYVLINRLCHIGRVYTPAVPQVCAFSCMSVPH